MTCRDSALAFSGDFGLEDFELAISRQQLADATALAFGDAVEDVGESCPKIGAVEPSRLDHGIADGSGLASGRRSHEQIVFLPRAIWRNARSAALWSSSR